MVVHRDNKGVRKRAHRSDVKADLAKVHEDMAVGVGLLAYQLAKRRFRRAYCEEAKRRCDAASERLQTLISQASRER